MELTSMFEPTFTNRDENGLETNTDGHGETWDREESFEEYNTTYTPKQFTNEEEPEELTN